MTDNWGREWEWEWEPSGESFTHPPTHPPPTHNFGSKQPILKFDWKGEIDNFHESRYSFASKEKSKNFLAQP